MGIKELIGQFNCTEMYKQLKILLASTFEELDLQKVESLKLKHQQIFCQIRLEYIDLLNAGRRFCEESNPRLQYSIELLERSSVIDCTTLRQLLLQIDPQPVIRQCEVLQKKITSFNDKVKVDPDYKNQAWKSVVKSIIAGILVVGSIAIVAALPLFIPLELGIITAMGIGLGTTLPGLVQFCIGLVGTKLQDDVQSLIEKLNQANVNLSDLKKRMSEMIEHQGSIKLRLNNEDTKSLLKFYRLIEQDIKEIKEICTKSAALF